MGTFSAIGYSKEASGIATEFITLDDEITSGREVEGSRTGAHYA